MFLALIATLAADPTVAPAGLDAIPQTRLAPDLRCQLGTYRLPGGRTITITGRDGRPRALQYTLSDGTFGTLEETGNGSFRSDFLSMAFAPCHVGRIGLVGPESTKSGARIELVTRETSFVSDGIPLHGKLVLPPGGRARHVAVWVEGSNNNPSTDDTVWQFELARRGVAVFVYDKRGTGASGGMPTSDFHARARDTAAAVTEARRLAPGIRRVGVIGASQGGWVAPLTATMVQLDFVVSAYGMAEGPIAQDRDLVLQQVRQGGFGSDAQDAARNLTTITERIVRSNMREGFSELEAFKASHADAGWTAAIQPRSYTGIFLRFSSEDIRIHGPVLSQGLTFDFEPKPIIETIAARQLWLLGGADQQAPNAGTQAILRTIQQRRQDLAVVVFPRADHGLVEPVNVAGQVVWRYSADQFDVVADWIKAGQLPARGRFIVMGEAR